MSSAVLGLGAGLPRVEALGRMRGLSVLAVPVVDVFVEAVVVVAVIVLGVLHTRFSGVTPRGAAGTGTAARVGGVGNGLGGCPA